MNYSTKQNLSLLNVNNLDELMGRACVRRDENYGRTLTYSRKVFIPLTQLCRDVCHYCTFAHAPRDLPKPYLSLDEVVEIAVNGAQAGCQEVLFTLGDKPELRYSIARKALAELGFDSTIDYLHMAAERVVKETGLLPHLNPGVLNDVEYAKLRHVSASMGIMLETVSNRLCQPGGPHFGSSDKHPKVRLAAIEAAGRAHVPLTTGLLIGIGETRRERLLALLAINASHRRHGHIQEVIIQNFRAKENTLMSHHPEPDVDELLWTIAVARLALDVDISLQVPPNLNPGMLSRIIDAGINDWGGVSPVTPDHVNPEAPWPHLTELRNQTQCKGKQLVERLTVYPRYIEARERWIDEKMHKVVIANMDGEGWARADMWTAGADRKPEERWLLPARFHYPKTNVDSVVRAAVACAEKGKRLDTVMLTQLFHARDADYQYVTNAADELRSAVNGESVTYVINRNINYTNICTYHCSFCAFSKGKVAENLRDKAYKLDNEEIAKRVSEAWSRGATEVCLQGGIHPEYTGNTYLEILQAIDETCPGIHVHAFSPLEIHQGAATIGADLADYLQLLKDNGLKSLPGTAAEILVDQVRTILCPDKINTDEWLEVMRSAHQVGLHSTATIMFGHVDDSSHWAEHILKIRDLQEESLAYGRGHFTEFVPLPFVHEYAPLYKRRGSRKGPTFREAVLMHAVARLALNPLVSNIQTSWVKMGPSGVESCLNAGANDLGGTLMNESITRAAGASHGQEITALEMNKLISACGRSPRQRTTLYGDIKAAYGQDLCTDISVAIAGR
jgi:FO synthase